MNMSDNLPPAGLIVAGAGLQILSVEYKNEKLSNEYWVRLDAWFAVNDEVITALMRFRGIYFTCISEMNQVVIKQNYLRDRILFDEDFRSVSIDGIEYLNLNEQFEISQELDVGLNSGYYYLQASSFTCSSNILKIQFA